MGEVSQEGGGGHKKGGGKPKGKKQSTHIDMTPMVDLAFLLLTFFMLATSFNKPKVMEIVMPEKPKDQTQVPELAKERAMTILIGENDKLFYYFGLPDKNGTPQLERADYSPESIRKVIRERVAFATPYKGLFCIIKPVPKAKYKNIVDIFDEMNISKVPSYAIVDITPAEEDALKKY